jgi:hypothetical protein
MVDFNKNLQVFEHILLSKYNLYCKESGFQWLWMIGFLVKARVCQLLKQMAKGMNYVFQSWRKLNEIAWFL